MMSSGIPIPNIGVLPPGCEPGRVIAYYGFVPDIP
jgi:hypothetical protein